MTPKVLSYISRYDGVKLTCGRRSKYPLGQNLLCWKSNTKVSRLKISFLDPLANRKANTSISDFKVPDLVLTVVQYL